MTPVPKGRPRLTRYGTAYTPAKTQAAEQAIRVAVKRSYRDAPLDGPLSVKATFYLPQAKRNRKNYVTQKPDIDNLGKTVLDALNGVLWADDCQIVHLELSKHWATGGGEPGIDLEVVRVDIE